MPELFQKMYYGPNVQNLVESDDCKVMRLSDNSGEGMMTLYHVFPGVFLMYNDFHMKECVSGFQTDMDLLADGVWENTFAVKPEVFTREEKREWLDKMTDVALGSDAFFPFGDNIERAHKSGVKYVAQPGGSVRDDQVIETCNKYGMTMCFTGIRLFHH